MKKRILTFLLAVLLTVGLCPVSIFAAEFKFTDVPSDAWFYNDVKTAVDAGLVNGKTETTYCPDDLLTYAEAVKLAVCMHQKYTTGVVSLVNGDPWYKSYADYAKMNAIISGDYDWNAKATRAGYMQIFAHALPDAALVAKNDVPDNSIPDVPSSHPQAAEIYKLYRAGILEGSSAEYNGAWTQHLCKPSDNIKRSEVAAILTRMMFVDSRRTFSMGTANAAAPVITEQPKSVTVDAGQPATFKVKAEGKDLSYQWQYKKTASDASWTDVSVNGKAETYILTTEARHDGYNYRCVVSNAGGSVESAVAVLTVNSGDSLAIVKQPENYVLSAVEETAKFIVTIKGGKAPYTYKWNIEKATGSDFKGETTELLSNLFTYDVNKDSFTWAKYIRVYCEITDAKGAKVTTDKVEIVPFDATFKFTKQPADYKMTSLTDVPIFNAEWTGGKTPYKVSWHYYFTDISYDNIYTVENYQNNVEELKLGEACIDIYEKGHSIMVWLEVTDSAGKTITSEKALVIPLEGSASTDLKITEQPKTYTMPSADANEATFSATVSGGKAPYTFEWVRILDGTFTVSDEFEIPAQKHTVTVNGVKDLFAQFSKVEIKCIITDATGVKVTSNTVEIIPFAGSTADSLKASVDKTSISLESHDESYFLMASATGGTEPYSFQWYWGLTPDDMHDMSGWSANFSTDWIHASPDPRYYKYYMFCRVTDAKGKTADTPIVTVTIKEPEPLTITFWQDTFKLKIGQIVRLNPTVTGGEEPYTYKWYIGGETESHNSDTYYDYNPQYVGNYIIRLIVTDAKGNEAEYKWYINVTEW